MSERFLKKLGKFRFYLLGQYYIIYTFNQYNKLSFQYNNNNHHFNNNHFNIINYHFNVINYYNILFPSA